MSVHKLKLVGDEAHYQSDEGHSDGDDPADNPMDAGDKEYESNSAETWS